MKILCLGDSITDCNRLFSDDPLGDGYVSLLDQYSRETHPDWQLINRGVDGFTLSRLLGNVRSQYLSLRPDFITILIGINDIGLMMNTNRTDEQKRQLMEQFFANYDSLLTQFRGHRICLVEPFVFSVPEEFRLWQPYVEEMSRGIQLLAEKYHLGFLPIRQHLLLEAEEKGASALTTDGVHLTRYGHTLLARKLYSYLTA